MLNPRDSAELRSCLVSVLHTGMSGANEAKQVARCLAAVRALVNDVCSEFGSAWNKALPGIQQLPVELLCAVFQKLDLAHRVRATHVCRAWRAAGLQDRTLWGDICVGNRDAAQFEAMSAVLLRRSHPAPFRLAWPRTFDTFHYSPCTETWSEYTTNLSRMAGFDGPLDFARSIGLLDHAAPMLETFRISDSRTEVVPVPPQWGSAGTPRLRSMHIAEFLFTPHCARFETLRSFSGSLSHGDEAARLFELCPNLEDLVLRDVAKSSVLPPVPLPRSLASVTLSGRVCYDRWDPTALLARWMQDPPRCLTLQFKADLEPVLRLFMGAYPHGEWSMFVSPVLCLLSSAGQEYVTNFWTENLDFAFPGGVEKNPWAGLPPLFDQLGTLTVRRSFFLDLCNAQLALPHLHTLRIFLHDVIDALGWGSPAASLRAPALADLVLVWIPQQSAVRNATSSLVPLTQGTVLDLLFSRVPRDFRALVAYEAQRLARVRVVLPPAAAQAETPRRDALAALAHKLDVRFDPRLCAIDVHSSELSRLLDAI